MEDKIKRPEIPGIFHLFPLHDHYVLLNSSKHARVHDQHRETQPTNPLNLASLQIKNNKDNLNSVKQSRMDSISPFPSSLLRHFTLNANTDIPSILWRSFNIKNAMFYQTHSDSPNSNEAVSKFMMKRTG